MIHAHVLDTIVSVVYERPNFRAEVAPLRFWAFLSQMFPPLS